MIPNLYSNEISINIYEVKVMSKNYIIVLVLIAPIAIWLNLYAYYKYGKSLINLKGNQRIKTKKRYKDKN
jgi:hypothetical protein